MQDLFQLAYWIPLLPLLGALINGLGRNHLNKTVSGLLGSATVLGSFVISVLIFFQVKAGQSGVVHYFDFIRVGSFSIPFAFQLDALSSLFLLIITGVGFLIHVYSTSYMHEEEPAHVARYFAYLNLFVFSMLLLVLGSNYVILFMGWEGVGLCSYLLIGYWFKNPAYTAAANKAFIMNRIGDLALLVALFWIITKSGVVSFQEFFAFVQQHQFTDRFTATDITVITILFFIGATGKSAQLPLYTWLPDAMAGPTPVSALIHAATMVTAGIYLIARSNILYSLAPHILHLISWVGLLTALLAASIAVAQNDIKKVLAYSTVSQLGFMFLALGTGAYAAAVFHVMTHAFFKALLFLGSGSVIHAMGGEQDIRNMGGLSKKLRITYITFLIGCVAIAGVPPFSGFFSKDAILLSVFLHSPLQYALALLAALLTAFYMFRLLFLTFSGRFRGTQEQLHHLHESPLAMTLPLLVLAVLSIIGGWVGIPAALVPDAEALPHFLSPVIPMISHTVSHETEYALMALSTGLIVAMIVAAWVRYNNYQPGAPANAFINLLENKWYVDELYQTFIVQPLFSLAGWLRSVVEAKGIDGLVNGVGRAVQYSARQLRLVQTGQVGLYVLLMVLAMALMLLIQFFIRK